VWVLAFAIGAIASPAHASTLEELARAAVFDHCPELMSYDGVLSEEANIVAAGYQSTGTLEHDRAGTLDVVEQFVGEGKIWIGNARDVSLCQVGIEGPMAKAVFDALYAERDGIAGDLTLDESEVPQLEGVRIITLRTEAIEGGYIGVQFVDPTATNADAPLTIQQYFLEE
jgi:hypothetical protein